MRNMPPPSVYYGVVLVIVLVLIAYFATRALRRASRGRQERYTWGTPATPAVRVAVGDLFASLKHTVVLSRGFVALEAPGAGVGPLAGSLAGAKFGIARMADTLDRAEKGLSETVPTYANYLAVYRGLAGADATLLSAANAYAAIGRAASQASGLTASGEALLAIERQLRRVVETVHRLGAALNVE